jgi:hypothetical protein
MTGMIFKAYQKLPSASIRIQPVLLSYHRRYQLSRETITKTKDQLEEEIQECHHRLVTDSTGS